MTITLGGWCRSARGLGGVCGAELRSARRMARTWLFAALALAAGAVLYHGFGVNHFYNDTIAPRFTMPGIGLMTLWVLLIGMVFVVFDGPARDRSAQIVEALDARPISNVAVLGGRLLAAGLVVWLPLAVLAAGWQISGMVAAQNQWQVGTAPERISLLTFVVLDAPPALAFWGALVLALLALLRSRWAAAAVAFALLMVALVAIVNTPLYLLPALSGITHLGLVGSEILPRWPTGVDVFARVATIVVAIGLLVVAASTWPRVDEVPRGRRLLLGCAFAALGVAAIGFLAGQAQATQSERSDWARVHAALRDAPRLDVERVSGGVSIEPGRSLAIRVEVAARVPSDAAMNVLRFNLNPGMTVESVRLDGAKVTYTHDQGLLEVEAGRALLPDARVVLAIEAAGIPDQRFGYLDSAVDGMAETLLGSPLVLLGEQASLFDEAFVALTPAVRWLPGAGANFAAPPDFFELDLTVDAPPGWHLAGAGRTQDANGLRFQPAVPLLEFALVAAPFARRAITVQGVECELLIHPMHLGNVEYFADQAQSQKEDDAGKREEDDGGMMTVVVTGTEGAVASPTLALGGGGTVIDKLRDRLEQWLTGDHAPAYPHGVISLVEVPAQLRRYGGGWLMDNVQALPGIQLLAEHGFPTSRLTERPRWSGFPEERWLDYLVAQVEYSGAHRISLTTGATRNLLPFLARATGDGSAAMDYLVEWLTAWRLRGVREVAPAHWLLVGLSPRTPFLARILERAMASATMASGWFLFFPMELEDASEQVSFTGFDPASSENGADIMVHKGNLIALSIQQLLGARGVSRFLDLLRERHAGGLFTRQDFLSAMADVDPAVAPFLEHVLTQQTLPGFLASDASVDRLPDDEAGNPRYQIRVHVYNDESAPGVAGISYRTSQFGFQWSPFAHVPGKGAVEVGAVARRPPLEVRLETYLSLNRRILRLRVPPVDSDAVVDEPPLVGARASAWRPPDVGIVVDDLDAGFATVSPPPPWRLGGAQTIEETLPEFARDSSTQPRWRRQTDENAVIWGKYRRTFARIVAGKGEGKASFTAELPASGRWRLYYHLPGASVSEGHYLRAIPVEGGGVNPWDPNDSFGDMDIDIVAGEDDGANKARTVEVPFDAAQATPGWNHLGTYDLPAGPVQVVVSDATSGDIVVADAVRWQRAE